MSKDNSNGITVNNMTINVYLDHEKSKEIRKEMKADSRKALYKTIPEYRSTRGRSNKAKVINGKEEVFLHFIDQLPQGVQDWFYNNKQSAQAAVWFAWKELSITSTQQALAELTKLINKHC